jgi:transketolase
MSAVAGDERQASIERIHRAAYQLRMDVVDMVHFGGSGHPGGALSSADIMATLYWHVLRVDPARPDWPERDRFVMSKGHSAPILYAALMERGYFEKAAHIKTLRQIDSILQGHPCMLKTPGLDMSTGSLGQGLSVAVGMALGARLAGQGFGAYALLSDGEVQEGMIWEAAMAAAHHGVGNVTAIVDRNHLQVDGPTEEVMSIDPLDQKWAAFGWHVEVVDGHDIGALVDVFAERARRADDQPWVLLCDTVKGKGVSFMENVMEWHSHTIDEEQRAAALAELEAKRESPPPP